MSNDSNQVKLLYLKYMDELLFFIKKQRHFYTFFYCNDSSFMIEICLAADPNVIFPTQIGACLVLGLALQGQRIQYRIFNSTVAYLFSYCLPLDPILTRGCSHHNG